MQSLQNGSLLQGEKYKIDTTLGQGGFGITYLATQDILDRQVAVKEFFFRDYCEREGDTSRVTLGTHSNRETVERFLTKFIKEARTISKLHHPAIIPIYDIFRENGTAYYVMEYIEGESLGDMVKRRGALPEAEALSYIRTVGDALTYIHQRNINHLDVKPSNIMLRKSDNQLVLIDFGVAKQYDEQTKEGTTTTPVGISHGYSPAEQYKRNGVQRFSPQSDVYALAATLFKLLTGQTPPEATEIPDVGLPVEELWQKGVSASVISAIEKAMKPRSSRTQSIAEFISDIDFCTSKDSRVITEDTVVVTGTSSKTDQKAIIVSMRKSFWPYVSAFAFILCLFYIIILVLKTCDSPSSLTITANDIKFKMIRVDGGTFTLGEKKSFAHQVTLSSYYIGETEVTQALWKAVMGSNPSYIKSDSNPVEHVSWDDCHVFIRKLNILTGMNFRLPTEAEWEFAARGGNKSLGYKYSGSNDLDCVAWYNDNSYTAISDTAALPMPHDVRTKSSNELLLYDMSGNVEEWCEDGDSGYNSLSGASYEPVHVVRGGDCHDYENCKVSSRKYYRTPDDYYYQGLRLAL